MTDAERMRVVITPHEHVWSPGVNTWGPYWRRICEVCQVEMLTTEKPSEDEQFGSMKELREWWEERFGDR